MLLILFSWIYILFTTINLGFGFDKLFHLKNKDFVITSVLGLFSTTLLASIWAIFGRVNIEFHIFLLLLNLGLFFRFRNQISDLYKSFFLEIKQLQNNLKIVLAILTVLIIAQCSASPYIMDNESYYIQTIKWINEYGFVKGLANLHIFLGQISGWHITQSAFNFSFLYKNFNDLSGFCLLLGTVFSLLKLNEFYKDGNINYLIVGLFPIFNTFLFQFISAPSPDIPVYVFSSILFFYFLENCKNVTTELFNLITILVLFLIYIKNTTIALAFIPLILIVLHFSILSKKILMPVLFSAFMLSLYAIKNMITCGELVFPSKMPNFMEISYAIPDTIENFYYNQIKNCGYFTTDNEYNLISNLGLFLRWLNSPKLNGLFNKFIILLILIVPIFISKFQNKKRLWIIYSVLILQMLILFVTSPQYRFFMNFVILFSTFCFACITRNKKIINLLLSLSLVPIIIVLFFPLNLNQFARHKFMLKISNFSIANIIFPHNNTKNNTAFETIQIGNLKYNSPINNDFFWSNGDGNLPCLNKTQLEYFEKNFGIIPQMRTNDLKDGFYAKNISENE